MTSFVPPSPQYAKAMGWSPQDVNRVSRLDTPAGATAPPSGPPDPYQNAQVQKAIQLVTSIPGISAQMASQIMSEALAPVQAQIAGQQQNRAQYRSDLSGLISSNPAITPDQLQGYATSMYPNLSQKPYGQNALDAFSGLTTTAAATVGPGDLTPEDLPNMAALVQQQLANVPDTTDTNALQSIIDQVGQTAIGLGKNATAVAQAKQYARTVLARLLQTSRPDLISSLYGSGAPAPQAASAPMPDTIPLSGIGQGRAPIYGG